MVFLIFLNGIMNYKAVAVKLLLILFVLILNITIAESQIRKVAGIVRDKQSDEPLPYVSVYLSHIKKGGITDSLGKFVIESEYSFSKDTLRVTGIGYKEVNIPVIALKDSLSLTIKLEILPPKTEVMVKSKYSRALWFWKKIMKYKYKHIRSYWDNYNYEVYNRLELDLRNISKEKLAGNKLMKPFGFVLNYIDTTSEEKPFLPVYLAETLSDYYFQKSPRKTHEVIKATKVDGIDNESVLRQLGATYQNVDAYANFIPVFDKNFISPFNDNGDKYYNFKLLDTQYLSKKRLIHFRFSPKTKGADVFEGDCYVNDTSFALQKITMRPSVDANINFIGGLSIIQEYSLIYDSIWFLSKDKFVADINPIGEKSVALKGRKTTTYRKILLNDTTARGDLSRTLKAEQIDLLSNNNMSDSFWFANRHEELTKSEKAVYKLLDTLENNPTFLGYKHFFMFATTGVKDYGKIRLGPWFYWASSNQWEGYRFRFDLSTNRSFSDHLNLNGYLAYGTTDQSFKEKAEVKYVFGREPYSYAVFTYRNDMDNGQTGSNQMQLGNDNILATLFRRPGIPYKYQRIEETKAEYYKESNKGFHFGIAASTKQYTSLLNLPGKEFYLNAGNGTPLKTFETSFRLRYAFLERYIDYNFTRTSLGSDLPIVELKYTRGIQGILNSSYNYDKWDLSLIDYLPVPPYGNISYSLFASKVNGSLPFQFLGIMPGSEVFYYTANNFNLMKRYEFIADQYAGFKIEHNFGSGLMKYNTITRKMKLRQFWTAKGVVGSLSDANKTLNYVGNYPYHSLDGKMYLELGTGIDNILKFFRIDFIWRVLPSPVENQHPARFGVFGSFRVSF